MADKISLDWLSFTLRLGSESALDEAIGNILFMFAEDDIEWVERSRVRGYSRSGTICDGLGLVACHHDSLEMGFHVSLPSSALSIISARLGTVSPDGELELDFVKLLSDIFSMTSLYYDERQCSECGTGVLDERVEYRKRSKRVFYQCDNCNEEFKRLKPYVNFTRVDFAMDDFSGQLDLDTITEAALEKFDKEDGQTNWITSRFRGAGDVRNFGGGRTIYFGNRHASEVFCRIYDKAVQQSLEDFIWNRVEFVYRGDKADEIVSAISRSGVSVISESFLNYLQFNECPADERYQWPIAKWWSDFLDTTKKVVLGSGVPASTVQKTCDFLNRQISASLAMVEEALGKQVLVDLIVTGRSKLTEKHENMISAFRLWQQKQVDLVVVEDTDEILEWTDYTERKRYEQLGGDYNKDWSEKFAEMKGFVADYQELFFASRVKCLAQLCPELL